MNLTNIRYRIFLKVKLISLIFYSTLPLLFLLPHQCLATYREHFVNSDKVCPNPLHTTNSVYPSSTPSKIDNNFPKKTLLVNLPKTLSLFGSVNDFPCNFASPSNGDNSEMLKVIVRAIHPSTQLWDYSKADTCDSFIKFKRNDPEHTSNTHSNNQNKKEVICRVWKQQQQQHQPNENHSQQGESQYQGSFYHPMLWHSPNNQMTLSFSTYNWEYRVENNETVFSKPAYLQMVFLVYGDTSCSLRVQQYLIDPLETFKNVCASPDSSSAITSYQHCGQYECSEAKGILQSIGFRTYEIDDVDYAKKREEEKQLQKQQRENTYLDNNNSNDNQEDEYENSGGMNKNLTTSTASEFDYDEDGGGESTTSTAVNESVDMTEDMTDNPGRIASTTTTNTIDEEYNIFKTTTRATITLFNNSNYSFGFHNYHSYVVSSMIIVPLIILIVVTRCYFTRCRSRLSNYESSESLIVPLNTQVNADGTVELLEENGMEYHNNLTNLQHLHNLHHQNIYRSSWVRNNSMDYIQPIDVRNTHSLSATPSKSSISNPPSYETFGPPRYSDAVII